MPRVLAKLNFVFFGPTTSFVGLYRYQEGQNAQNMVPFNSPTDKLSNYTPFAYSFTENKNLKFWAYGHFPRLWLTMEASRYAR